MPSRMGKARGSRSRSGKVSGARPTVAKEAMKKTARGPRMKSTKYLARDPLIRADVVFSLEETKRALLACVEKIEAIARSCLTCDNVEELTAAGAQIMSITDVMMVLILYGIPADAVIVQPPPA